ncbi:hypothetical protein NBH00_02385 [Paraconexibacter antarcticus]|uniref:Secreted protein n=1 Tax=Paraconexibacter antarcticus TaxID=2949664 RepID=A0ABY5DTR1_9ACTN|nr:hypothetical protein [Paraconexibacter antarcticus]UTI65066.1 hypothetical protein NBH00_02385 [Paraconexibacter antarcticus]
MPQLMEKPTFGRGLRRVLPLAALACTAALPFAAPASSASGVSVGRRVCTPPKYPGKGGRSVSLTTFHLSCAGGRSISLAQYRCRLRYPGVKRTKVNTGCKTVRGYKCFEQRLLNKGYYYGKVECGKGRRDSVWIYRQKD